MRLLITGTSGFIGGYLANYFLSKKWDVWGLSRHENAKIQHQRFHWIKSDLAKNIPALPEIDYCILCAALSPAPGLKINDYIRNNIQATQHSLEALQTQLSCQRLFYLSGVSVYGQVKETLVDEETPSIDPDNYGMSKLLSERLLMDQFILPVTVLRLPGVLGPGSQTPWVVKQIRKAFENELIQAYNPEAFFNNAVWVEDIAKFIETLLNNEDLPSKNLFLLAAKELMSIREII